jgi:hypothetical protein
VTQHRDIVGDSQGFAQLVGDEDCRSAVGRVAPEPAQELVALPWREDGGRLVQDEDPCSSAQCLEDLDALLGGDR